MCVCKEIIVGLKREKLIFSNDTYSRHKVSK